jgi:hypothetical protein
MILRESPDWTEGVAAPILGLAGQITVALLQNLLRRRRSAAALHDRTAQVTLITQVCQESW